MCDEYGLCQSPRHFGLAKLRFFFFFFFVGFSLVCFFFFFVVVLGAGRDPVNESGERQTIGAR